jgi:hypothetical protein
MCRAMLLHDGRPVTAVGGNLTSVDQTGALLRRRSAVHGELEAWPAVHVV